MNPSELFNPELTEEYLESLQDQVDALRATNERLRTRIGRLEKEREQLQTKVGSRRRRAEPTREAKPDRSIEIPGVGRIEDLSLPAIAPVRDDVTFAVVFDEFSESAFRYELPTVAVPGSGWEEALEATPPDVLLVESAYRGMDAGWAGRVARFGRPSAELEKLVEWCRSRGVPAVFWNKEDPINHDWFIASASLFDVVLTVDSNMIDVYRKRLGHRRVDVLPFAAQPAIHHPPPEGVERPGSIAFAGSYFGAKHVGRREQMEMLLRPALLSGLQIFDRMNRPDDPRFTWPEPFRSRIVGSLTYPQTLEAYRLYQTFLNVNTVVDSPTMCARRVYELLASGTRVVSGPARALENVPVDIVNDEVSAMRLLSSHRNHDPSRGLDWVAEGNLISHRVDAILAAVG